MKRYYGDYVADCIFWVGEVPAHLPTHADWELTPHVRSQIREVESQVTDRVALQCIQYLVSGTPLDKWLETHPINPEIYEILEISIKMLAQEGKLMDPTSFLKGNILVDGSGHPVIIDPTYLIDKNSDKLARLLQRHGLSRYTELKAGDLLG